MEIKITIEEIKCSIRLAADKNKHLNLLATATLTFMCGSERVFLLSGFTVWKSKFGDGTQLNVEPPKNRQYKYFVPEASLKRKLDKIILDAYDYASIEAVAEA